MKYRACRKKRIFEKQAKNQQKHILKIIKTGPIRLRSILGPVFNL